MLMRLLIVESVYRPLALLAVALLCGLAAAAMTVADGMVEGLSQLRLQAVAGSSELLLRVRAPDPASGLSFARPILTEEDLQALEALPGGRSLGVIRGLPLPASMRVRIPGMINSRYDITLYTLEAEGLDQDIQDRWHAEQDLIPMLINPQLINLYNLGFADRYNTPRLSQQALQGIVLPLDIGEDLFSQLPVVIRDQQATVIGMDEDLPIWGAGIPSAYAESWIPRLYPEGAPAGHGPILASIRFADLRSFVAARQRIQERGLAIEGETALAQAVLQDHALAQRLSQGVLLLLAVFAGLAISGLAAAVLSERRRSVALLRSLGAGFHHLLLIYGGGFVLVAMLAAFCGSGIALLCIPYLLAQAAALIGQEAGPLVLPQGHLLWSPLLAACLSLLGVAPVLWRMRHADLLRDREQ